MPRWSALHIHPAGGLAQLDSLLTDHVLPATTLLLARGEISTWFFIRYGEGGPHLRWRLADATSDTLHRVRAAAAKAVPDGTVLDRPYEPEVDRYGGPEAIGPAEQLFAASSRVAASLVGMEPARRRSTTVDLLFAFLAAAGLAGLDAVGFLRRYANGYSQLPEMAGVDFTVALRTAERDFHRDPAAYLERRRLVGRLVADSRDAATSVSFWAGAVAGYVARLRELQSGGRLTAPVPAILSSQLHMLHNRLGLSIPGECHLAWLAAGAHLDAAAERDFHADGTAAADRVYHERSKFVPALRSTQHPHEPPADRAPSTAEQSRVDDIPLPDPQPGPLAARSLAEVLLARGTSREFNGGETGDAGKSGGLDADGLGRLLHYTAGVRGEPARRPFPSAGGMASTRLMVLARHVAGVPPALYEHLPLAHSLRRVAADPGVDRLTTVAPQFTPGAPHEISPAAVALWLFVVADLGRIRTGYGVRGYRFAAIEAGHLAQNLLLAATAAELPVAPLGGFFDDHVDHILLLDGVESTALYVLVVGAGPGSPPRPTRAAGTEAGAPGPAVASGMRDEVDPAEQRVG